MRRAVPTDLRKAVGKREELVSLRTKEPGQARVKYARVLAEVEACWTNLRAGQRSLTEREAHSIARAAHEAWLLWHDDEPSQQFVWRIWLYRYLWLQTPPVKARDEGTLPIENMLVQAMRRLYFVQADNALVHHGLVVDEFSRLKLAKALGGLPTREPDVGGFVVRRDQCGERSNPCGRC